MRLNSLPAWYVKGDFVVHLAGLRGGEVVMFRYYYKTTRNGMVSRFGRWRGGG